MNCLEKQAPKKTLDSSCEAMVTGLNNCHNIGDKGKNTPGPGWTPHKNKRDKRKPNSGSDGKPAPGSDGKPAPGSDGKPAPGSDGKPAPGSDGKPAPGSDGKPAPGSDGKPAPGGKAQPGGRGKPAASRKTLQEVESRHDHGSGNGKQNKNSGSASGDAANTGSSDSGAWEHPCWALIENNDKNSGNGYAEDASQQQSHGASTTMSASEKEKMEAESAGIGTA